MMKRISLANELLNAEKLAVKEGLTFYDASYLLCRALTQTQARDGRQRLIELPNIN